MGEARTPRWRARLGLWAVVWMLGGAAVAKEPGCAVLLADRHLHVSAAAKEALALGRRTGIREMRVVLQIPTGARGVLPPYVQLHVERDRLHAALESAGGRVASVAPGTGSVARMTLEVLGPYEKLLPLLLSNRWVARLETDGDQGGEEAGTQASADHEARKRAAWDSARAQAIRPTHVDLESRIVGVIAEGYRPAPESVDVQLLATVGPSSLFLATLPVDRGHERRSLAFVLRIDTRGDAHDAHVERVLSPEELAALFRPQ